MASSYFGAYRAIVGGTADPGGGSRVQVRIPAVLGDATQWARVCRPIGAPAAVPPRSGSEVLVVFEGGDPHTPYVIGSLW